METEALEPILTSLFGDNTLLEFCTRYLTNLLLVVIIIRFIYYTRHRNKDFVFTFLLFNTIIFIICYLLGGTTLKTNLAFGLFAIFSLLRYRTVLIPIREMGYFFASITLGMLNSLSSLCTNEQVGVLLVSNALIIVVIYLLDKQLYLDHESMKEITYERIELIKPDNRKEMIQDLQKRTGLPIHKVEIVKIDFLRDIARIKVFYYSKENESSTNSSGDNDD